MSEHITAQDLANTVGQKSVDRIFDEDGDGRADDAIVSSAMAQADSTADSLLLTGFAQQQIDLLAQDDSLLRMHIAWLAMHYGARRKHEWRDDQGRAMYWQEYADAQAYLKALAKAAQRSSGEAQAGPNANVGGQLNRDRPLPAPAFIFAGTRDKPAGSGGF